MFEHKRFQSFLCKLSAVFSIRILYGESVWALERLAVCNAVAPDSHAAATFLDAAARNRGGP